MTNEEAIKILDDITSYCDFTDEYGDMINSTPYFEALDMAIKALEQEPCEDCISRQYLIERATSWDKHFADSERCVSLTEIQNAPSVTPNARWIPCSDKMPDINIHVLAQFVMGGMAECYYAHNWWHIVGGFRISGDEVIAWQPLPELYKAESEE